MKTQSAADVELAELGATMLAVFSRYLHRSGERLFDPSSLSKFAKNFFSVTFLWIV